MGVMKIGSMSYKLMAFLERKLYKRADAILGQSNEILNHISKIEPSKKLFLYRNLQKYEIASTPRIKSNPFKIIFAGMLGVAQDVLSIVKNIDFKSLEVEFHIVGGGAQYELIKEYIVSNPNCNIVLHGIVPKEKMAEEYSMMDAAIVPLMVNIKGAFPSKIFDILPMGLPILFSGSGEGASFIENNNIGYVSDPSDYNSLTNNIKLISSLSEEDYRTLSSNCLNVVHKDLDFDNQISSCYNFLIEASL
jgi:glycosyltransferase involved in cell wall biosynthesis